jgi:glycosyltransferase involved in cell wall biosynthesis
MSESPMRFCLVTTFYPPYNFGGDGIAVRRLAVALAQRGHHVEVVHCVDAFRALQSRRDTVAPAYADDPNIVHHGLRSRGGVLSPLFTQQSGRPGLKAPRLRRVLREGRFDVVHFHNASLIGATALGYATDAVTLYTMHEHWLVCPMHVLWRYNREACTGKQCIRCSIRGGRPPQLWRYTGLLDRNLRHVEAFIAPSRFTREKHLEFGLKVDAPIVHIPNFLPSPDERAAPSPHPKPYFLFVGRLEPIKGAQTLVDAFMHYDRADLLIAGDGTDADALRVRAAGRAHIRFLGPMRYEAIEILMRHAIAVIVPSVGFEVFPTTVLEANAQGTPVVGRRLGPLPEMLDDRGGLTYATESELLTALERLRTDQRLRDEIGSRGRRQYLAEWTPERHLQRYFDLITSIKQGRKQFA